MLQGRGPGEYGGGRGSRGGGRGRDFPGGRDMYRGGRGGEAYQSSQYDDYQVATSPSRFTCLYDGCISSSLSCLRVVQTRSGMRATNSEAEISLPAQSSCVVCSCVMMPSRFLHSVLSYITLSFACAEASLPKPNPRGPDVVVSRLWRVLPTQCHFHDGKRPWKS